MIDWRKIKNDNRKEFDRMFDFYYHSLCAISFRYLNNRQAAEDVVVDCFVKIWENRASLNISSSLSNYLITIVKNLSVDFIRKESSLFVDLEKATDSISEDEKNYIHDAGLLNDLYKAINKLPEQRREILKLAAFDGKTYPQIAEELNISINTVKTQMSRSYRFLKDELDVSKLKIMQLLLMI
nr:RNA polymerase sigma-70 factor [uncultured Carboxylicivirga sp.]